MARTRSLRKQRTLAGCLTLALGLSAWSTKDARADVALVKAEKNGDWEVTTSGRVNAYLSYLTGDSVRANGLGNQIDPTMENSPRFALVGPWIGIRGITTPEGPIYNVNTSTKLSTMRIRGGFASTILGFNIYNQITDDLRVTFKLGIWAGIQNDLEGGVRPKNAAIRPDFRQQWVQLEGPWGAVWGGRRVGLFNRGGMKLNWHMIHKHGVGHPCNVDGSGTATCGHTGVGSFFPNRNAQIGYRTPSLGGAVLSVAMFDPSTLNGEWNRAPLPRFEAELEYDPIESIHIWVNGLTQVLGREQERVANVVSETLTVPAIPADKEVAAWGVGAGAWFLGGDYEGAGEFGIGATYSMGQGLGTGTLFGPSAMDETGELRMHNGLLAAGKYRISNTEFAASYGLAGAEETDWDRRLDTPIPVSVIQSVQGIGFKVAQHVSPIVFSIDGMLLQNKWHRKEVQNVTVVSAGLLGEW